MLHCPWAAPHLSPLCPGFPAVVSLRQIQRKAVREKERNQELRRLQDEARKEEGLRLTQRLQELERDKNLMLVGDGRDWALGLVGVRGVERGGGGSAWVRWRLTLSFPGHLAAGGSPLPLQAAATLGSSSFPNGEGEVCGVQPQAPRVFSTCPSSSGILHQAGHER